MYVVLFHNGHLFDSFPSLFKSFIDKGYYAVDAFFVLSGFILTYNYIDQQELNKRKFFVARFARIYPLYFLSLILAFPLFAYFIYSTDFSHWMSIVGFTGISTFAMVQTFNPFWLGHFNPPSWSLSVEMVFYLIFPFILIMSKTESKLKLGLLLLLVFVIDTSFTAVIRSKGILSLLFAVLFIAVTAEYYIGSSLLESKGLILLGNASYGIYILQDPIRSWVYLINRKLNIIQSEYWITIVFIAGLIIFSVISYKFIEVPVQRFIKSKLDSKL